MVAARFPDIFTPEHAPLARELLRDYYLGVNADGSHRFTGAYFDTLGGPWREPETHDRITAADLVAVTCLSVSVPARAAVRLLERQADEISGLLQEMPSPETHLWQVEEARLEDKDSPTSQLWRLLRSGDDGMGPTTTSKLMARKRPATVPVYDSVIGGALGLKDCRGHWATMRSVLNQEGDGQPLHATLADLIEQSGLDLQLVTPLRAFDVIVWYAHNPAPATRRAFQAVQDRLVSES